MINSLREYKFLLLGIGSTTLPVLRSSSGARYGNRTRLSCLGSKYTTTVLISHCHCYGGWRKVAYYHYTIPASYGANPSPALRPLMLWLISKASAGAVISPTG